MSLLAVAAAMAVMLMVGFVIVVLIQRPPRITSVVLVVLDTVRADHTSAYGYSRPTTPRLDALAQQGLLFEHARAVAPWTLPSHASLFTGRLPHQHGCHWEHRWLADSQETIAETLAAAGFTTFGVTTNPNASSLYHLDQGFASFQETWRLRDRHRGLADSAIANLEIRRFLERRDRERPFFVFVNYSDAHLPYSPPPPNDRLFGPASERARRLAARGDLLQATLTGAESIGPGDGEGLAALYDGEVRTADQRLGELLDLLDEFDLAADTVVIVTSDHGEHLGEEGRVDHQLSLDEALLRVPLVVRFPRQVRPARVLEPVALTDVKGWIDDLADGRVPGWSPPPDLAPTGFLAEYLRPVDLVDVVRAAGGDPRRIDRRLAALFRPDVDGGIKLVLAERDDESFLEIDGRGVERRLDPVVPAAAADLRRILSGQLASEPFSESVDDFAAASEGVRDDSAELRRLGYVGGGAFADVGVHASEHWSAGLRARRRGDLPLARRELEMAQRLAPGQPAIEEALAHVLRELQGDGSR